MGLLCLIVGILLGYLGALGLLSFIGWLQYRLCDKEEDVE